MSVEKMKIAAGALAIALALTACAGPSGEQSQTQQSQSSSQSQSDASGASQSESGSESSQSSQAQIPSPVTPYDTPDFTDAAGFAVTGFPEDEDIHLEECSLIDSTVAQLTFTVEEGTTGVLRVAKDTGEDISGVYTTFEEESTDDYDGVSVTYRASAGGPYLVTWVRDGYAYSLYFEHAPMGMVGGIMDRFIEGVRAEEPAA